MIRDPSDGTVREKQKSAPPDKAPHNSGERLPNSDAAGGGADASEMVTGLPDAPAKSDELIRLEKSREWLKGFQSITEQSETSRDHPATKDAAT